MARDRSAEREFFTGLARAAGGALLFGLPILLTSEMWELGFHLDRPRFVLLILVTIPLLAGLASISGFKKSTGWIEDVVDAFVALAVGYVTSALILWMLGLLDGGMSAGELIGKVSLQAVSASIGALLASSQFGESGSEQNGETPSSGYGSELMVMGAGALFLAFNIAPTSEVMVTALRMGPIVGVVMVVVSIVIMHAFVYAVQFRGQATPAEGMPAYLTFLKFTIVGYAMVLLVSLYVLWTFGRLDGTGAATIVQTVIVLAFPASIGAASARLVI